MKSLLLPLLLLPITAALAQTPTLTIEAGRATAKSSPLLYGLMTEEINHCYDGGLYAELVRNRAFLDDANKPAHWSVVQRDGSAATIALDPGEPLNPALPVSLRLQIDTASPQAPAGIANEGYWGIPVQPDTRYRASFYAKASPNFSGPVTVSIESDDGATVYAKAEVPHLSSKWQPYTATLLTGKEIQPTAKARLVLTAAHPGTIWLDLVSLFPPTWKDRPNGLRRDLMQMLVDLKPAFLRFPGGNYLEGDTIETRFDWKKTLGPLDSRPGHQGPWSYRSSDGMGLMEFLQWCEDLGAEPILAVYAGYSLKGAFVKPGPDLQPYVQDALDEIEYLTGPATSKWGARRAKDGHPAPFSLRYVEIGNEDFFDRSGTYDARFAQFSDAIKAKYPQIKCISTVGNEQKKDKLVRSRKPDALDEHYYYPAEKFIAEAPTRFEKYDRHGPEIFVGEWASHETSFPPWDKRSRELPVTPTMKAALGDAAWMLGMERNSDIVAMHCYAPLLANVNAGASQWRPDMIGYDALHSYGSPSYYAFQMFSRNHGDEILKATISDSPVQYSVTRDSKSGAIFIKLLNPTPTPESLNINLLGLSSAPGTATVTTLSADPNATNSLSEPAKVAPVTSKREDLKPVFDYNLPPNSITVLRLDAHPR